MLIRWEKFRSSTLRPLTQTAPDEESEAE